MIERGDIEAPFYTADLTIDDVDTWTPVLDIGFDGGTLQLTHFNVLVRTFDNEDANHVEVRVDKVLKGIRMAQDIIDLMLDYDYSYRWDKRVDEQTVEWLAAVEASHLDEEFDEFQDES